MFPFNYFSRFIVPMSIPESFWKCCANIVHWELSHRQLYEASCHPKNSFGL